jgi:bifunctional non-homologous end joining protein LigD
MLARPGTYGWGAGWIYELEYGGFRCLAIKRGTQVRMLSRRGRDMAHAFPELVQSMRALPDVVLDGELAICDKTGCPNFERLGARSRMRDAERIRVAAAADPAVMFAFDLLVLAGQDYRHYPLMHRKAQLAGTLTTSERIVYAQHFDRVGDDLLALAQQFAAKGIIAKDGSAPYWAGHTDRWVKIKPAAGAEWERRSTR